MNQGNTVVDGLYRLIKLVEDHNPLFPSEETVVEIKDGEIINLSTRRRCALTALGAARALYGPIKTPYDVTPIDKLPEILLSALLDQSGLKGSSADE